jgi:hypothetical protein
MADSMSTKDYEVGLGSTVYGSVPALRRDS